MTYSGNSSPLGGASAAPDKWRAAIAVHNAGDADAIVQAYQAYAPLAGLLADTSLAQACIETGFFTSPAWTARRNPAGIGITGASVSGPNFGSIDAGVQAHLDLLRCYFISATPIWTSLHDAGYGGFFLGKKVLSDLNGVWAVPGTTYGQNIASVANNVLGAIQVAGVYGEDLVNVAKAHIGEMNSDGTLDPWNGAHPWPGWCEAFSEGLQYAAGLDVVHRASAADKLDAVSQQGLLQTAWPPEHGGICLWGRAFDPEGHTCIWDDDAKAWISTLYPPNKGIDHFYSDSWKNQMAGWYRAPGVIAARRQSGDPPNTPATVWFAEGNPYGVVPMRDIFWARWDYLNTNCGTVKLDHPGVVNPTGMALPTLGYPVAQEVTLSTGRRIQRFERAYLATQGATDPFNLVSLLISEYPQE